MRTIIHLANNTAINSRVKSAMTFYRYMHAHRWNGWKPDKTLLAGNELDDLEGEEMDDEEAALYAEAAEELAELQQGCDRQHRDEVKAAEFLKATKETIGALFGAATPTDARREARRILFFFDGRIQAIRRAIKADDECRDDDPPLPPDQSPPPGVGPRPPADDGSMQHLMRHVTALYGIVSGAMRDLPKPVTPPSFVLHDKHRERGRGHCHQIPG
jgi:hypothetical protein